MTIRKRSRRAPMRHCANGCQHQRGGVWTATHVAVILDYETPLCSSCAKTWPAIWQEALEREAVPA